MTQSPRKKQQTTTQPPDTKHAAILLLKTIADTTWRAFVPTIGGTIAGVMLDNIFSTAPLFVVIMIALGFLSSAVLIAIQLRNVRRS